jgi:hypothetical protein
VAGRRVAFGPGYRRAQDRLGITADRELLREVGRLMARIAAETLPSASDIRTSIPPVLPVVYARRVGQHNLWLFFDLAREGEVRFITLTRTPPVPRN